MMRCCLSECVTSVLLLSLSVDHHLSNCLRPSPQVFKPSSPSVLGCLVCAGWFSVSVRWVWNPTVLRNEALSDRNQLGVGLTLVFCLLTDIRCLTVGV